jgi:hypothetical protein
LILRTKPMNDVSPAFCGIRFNANCHGQNDEVFVKFILIYWKNDEKIDIL